MIESIVPFILRHWPSAFLLLTLTYLTKNRYGYGIQKYSGPFLASLTDWWRFFDVLGYRPDITQLRLHRRYGDIVRLGPNCLSFADPQALKTIYGLNKGFVKSKFYPVQQALSKGKRLPSLFGTTDERYHAELRKSINSAFSMTAIVQYEPSIDDATEKFLDQTEAIFVANHTVCDFARWLQFVAFDVVGQITYSKRHGFVDRNEDVDGMVAWLGNLFSYVAPIGQMPWLDQLLLKNPILRLLDIFNIKAFGFPVVGFAKARMDERLAIRGKGSENKNGREDLLSMFLRAKEARPEFFHDGRVLTMAVSMALAGSETTGISLAAVFYYLLKEPRCYRKLMQEIDSSVVNGKIENRKSGIVSWAESQQLPYLDVCIKEAFRLHPAVGLPLERVVPAGGVKICGEVIPGGTIVGCNAWVIHQRPEIFGEDAEMFRPERWIEADKEKRKEMESTMFHFGMGARTCIGKNISLMEIYKLVPSFLRRFEVELANTGKEWKLHNAWFVRQNEFDTVFRCRRVAGFKT